MRRKRFKDAAAAVLKARSAMPHTILQALAKEYKSYIGKSRTEAEEEFWIKCSRASANLGSGMEKWLEEMLDADGKTRQRKRRSRK